MDFRKCPNQKTHESESAGFYFGHFPRSKIVSESSFYTKSYIITILNFFVAFCLKNGASKFGFTIVFWKCDLTTVGSLFWRNNSEKAKHPKKCLSFGGSMPIAQIKRIHLHLYWGVSDYPKASPKAFFFFKHQFALINYTIFKKQIGSIIWLLTGSEFCLVKHLCIFSSTKTFL